MDEIINQIEKIREINKQHKLVAFVGAGVSMNSDVCSWWDLIKEIAEKIGYNDICENCKLKYSILTDGDDNIKSCGFNGQSCQYKYNFSNEEFLKIPQYFFDIAGEEEYIKFLRKKFCKKYDTNAIDELIVELEPQHIITTNYEHLIEDVKTPNISDYTVIKSDSDLLKKDGSRYIIKMHGDIDEIENVVLKEDDYLNYSKNHELIETYIKSLLIDKTFLFIGYSLNDNNLKLIMSYIDYFVKDMKIERSPHYLVTNQIIHKGRDFKYWKNKGIELVDLSMISESMISKSMMEKKTYNLKERGKPLYAFLKYIKDDKLPYSDDKVSELKKSLYKSIDSLKPFNYINYSTLLKICNFSYNSKLISNSLHIVDETEYKNLQTIFNGKDGVSFQVKDCFIKAGIYSIHCYDSKYKLLQFNLTSDKIKDEFFDLSMNWAYPEIIRRLSKSNDTLEKAYYYSLIYRNKNNKCIDVLSNFETEIKAKDYKYLSIEDKYKIAILQYNFIAIRLLNYNTNNQEKWDKLNNLLESASLQSKAFEYIKKICGNNDDTINQLNQFLINHEEYYMCKSTKIKFGGTIYGDIYKLQSIVYDYYLFYKKNFLMLDWFNNVSKMCQPYIKAILCTYYPDEYQYSNSDFGRTRVKPYPLNLIDIDMIVRHTNFKNFNSWLSYYKVFNLTLEEDIDIAEIFDNFCSSERQCCFTKEHVNMFGMLLSLVNLTKEEKHKIILSFMKLVTPNEEISEGLLLKSLKALCMFVKKHHDMNDTVYVTLLKLLVDKKIITNLLGMENEYQYLVSTLACHADIEVVNKCRTMLEENVSQREKAFFTYIFKDILLKFDKTKCINLILENIQSNYSEEVFDYLQNDVLVYNKDIKIYFEKLLKKSSSKQVGVIYSNNESKTINQLVILLLKEKIPSIADCDFLKQYCSNFDYLDFLFNPDTFDYHKVKIADYMWCNFMSVDKYRDIILKHKDNFWNKEEEKRIRLGFGGTFENKIAYKYLID